MKFVAFMTTTVTFTPCIFHRIQPGQIHVGSDFKPSETVSEVVGRQNLFSKLYKYILKMCWYVFKFKVTMASFFSPEDLMSMTNM